MKSYLKISVVFILVTFLSNISFSHDLKTPKGSNVTHYHPGDTDFEFPDGSLNWQTAEYWTSWADDYWRALYIERIGRANQAYNCHAYAWADSRQSNSGTWCTIETQSNASVYWTDHSYYEISFDPFDNYPGAKKIIYDTKEHSLLVDNISENIVTSKWGKMPCYRHYLYSDPYDGEGHAKYYKFYKVYVPQDFSSIYDAIDFSESGQEIYVSNSQTLSSGNISVPSGITLIIQSSATIDLNHNSIISDDGTIIKESSALISGLAATTYDGSLFSSIQPAINHASYYDNINIQSGTFNEYLEVNNKVLSFYGQGVGSTHINDEIRFVNCEGGQLCYLTSYYVTLDDCYNVNTWSHEILDACDLFSYYSTELDIGPTVNNSEDGVTFYNSSGYIDYSHFENDETGIYLNSSSTAVIYGTSFCLNDMDVAAYNYSSADANPDDNPEEFSYPNTFSRNPAPVTTGSVVIPSTYSTCGMPKSSVLISTQEKDKIAEESANKDFVLLMDSYNKLSSEVRQDTKQNGKFNKDKFTGRYTSIIDSMKSFIKSNSNSNWSKTVLSTAVGCYKKLNDYQAMKKFLDETLSDKNLLILSGLSKRFMIDYYNNQKDYSNSISLADEIIKEHQQDKDLLCDVQFEKGLLYQYSLSNNDEAIKCYNSILTNYPDNVLTKPAKRHLKSLGIVVKENAPKLAANTESNFSLDNYPNPFNPSTTISYTLKQNDHVILIVYDILGKEVQKLVDGIQTKGEHAVNFNGKNLPSGIYIYKLIGNNFNISKKMLLIK